MTRSDAIKLVGLVVTAYPNSDKFSDSAAIDNTVSLWAEFFTDDDVAVVAMALKKHIAISKWPPSIAEIKEIMLDICSPDIITPSEAWAVVAMHIDTSSEYEYLTDPARIFPTAIANAILAVGYRTLRDLRCRRYDHSGKKTGLDRVAFLQAYEPEYERMRKNAVLPASLQMAISHTQDALSGESRQLFNSTKNRLEAKHQKKIAFYHQLEHTNHMKHLEASKNNALSLQDGEKEEN